MSEEQEIQQLVDARISHALNVQDERNRQYLDKKMEEMRDWLKTGFPEGDPVEHRKYHQTQMKYMQDRIELWRDIRKKTLAGAIWLLLLGAGKAIWEALILRVQGGP